MSFRRFDSGKFLIEAMQVRFQAGWEAFIIEASTIVLITGAARRFALHIILELQMAIFLSVLTTLGALGADRYPPQNCWENNKYAFPSAS